MKIANVNQYYYETKKITYPLARYFQARDLKNIYNRIFPSMCIIGISGSCGKTSIALRIYYFLKNEHKNVAYMGTHKILYQQNEIKTNNTTLEPSKLIEICDKYKIHPHFFVMEVSSHSINEARINCFHFKYVLFTNLGQDHLEYHLNQSNYFQVKKAFIQSSDALKIINIEDPFGKILWHSCKKVIKYGDLKLFENTNKIDHSNLQACYVLLKSMHFQSKKIIRFLQNFNLKNGRNEVLYIQNKKIIIDYAHLPESYEALLNNNEEKIVIFGCGGNRDVLKRSKIGDIVEKYAIYSIITSDNSRNESFENIAMEISKNMKHFTIIQNRKEAIKKGLDLLKTNQTLYIIGKGDEDYIEEKNMKFPFNDKEFLLNMKE